MNRLEMKNYSTILIKKLQNYQPYHQAKFLYIYIYIYECLTGEEIWPSNQKQIIEQTKFTNSPLGKAFEKQIKIIKDQEKNK